MPSRAGLRRNRIANIRHAPTERTAFAAAIDSDGASPLHHRVVQVSKNRYRARAAPALLCPDQLAAIVLGDIRLSYGREYCEYCGRSGTPGGILIKSADPAAQSCRVGSALIQWRFRCRFTGSGAGKSIVVYEETGF